MTGSADQLNRDTNQRAGVAPDAVSLHCRASFSHDKGETKPIAKGQSKVSRRGEKDASFDG
jgi:hypothetical protein